MLLLECVPEALATLITESVEVPVIGIGAGRACDGQVLVLHDMLGITPRAPRFSQNFMQEGRTIPQAIRAYVEAVKGGSFPADAHCFV